MPISIPVGSNDELCNRVVKIEIDREGSALVLHLEPVHGRDGFLRIPVEEKELARLRISD